MEISNQIEKIKPQLDELIKVNKEPIEKLNNQVEKIVEVSSNFNHNWVGAWASPTYNHYNNFIDDRGGVLQFNEEQIQSYIEDQSGISFREIKDAVLVVMKRTREFHDELVTELSIIKGEEILSSENEILSKIEETEWGISPHDWVKMKRPSSVFTYNPAAVLNKGLDTPPHLNVDGEIMSLFTMFAAVEDFQKNAKRLIRQLELKYSGSKGVSEEPSSSTTAFIYSIIESFHTVANQLRNRHNNRETLSIKDEYDVQDLLHSLLKIQYTDVRAEEYTPSYAGSSTRVDFLLKNEKIVVEVKKTRDGLKDGKVGDQLILDAQHYKSHPDCKHLICFVYDPEGRIQNPRGLEDDLSKLTNDELFVEVFIRP